MNDYEIFLRKAPDWVNWLAQDEDGSWWGFEAEPNESDYTWYENEVGRYVYLGKGDRNMKWRETLYKM